MPEPVDALPPLVVPVKSFRLAKARLAAALDPERRATMARRLAEGVTDAARPGRVVVACDDADVRTWAEERRLEVSWTPGRDLSGAVGDSVAALGAGGATVVGVAHADLPFPAGLRAVVDRGGSDRVVIVPDRDRDGTNVVVVPTRPGFEFTYGPGSFARHCAEADRLGLELVVVEDPALAWDVDEPADLEPPDALGPPMWDRDDG